MTSTPQTPKRYDPLTGNDEYAVVRVRPSWGLLSILIFVYSLPIRYWINYLPWHPFHYFSRPGTMLLATLGLSIVGMILAWIGLRAATRGDRERASGINSSKIGLFLNGAVFGILVIAVTILVIWWRFLR